jgi:hypothetical protein
MLQLSKALSLRLKIKSIFNILFDVTSAYTSFNVFILAIYAKSIWIHASNESDKPI